MANMTKDQSEQAWAAGRCDRCPFNDEQCLTDPDWHYSCPVWEQQMAEWGDL